jgi:hypothetical protein
MSGVSRADSPLKSGLDEVVSLLQAALEGPFRRDVVADAARAPNLDKALQRLRDGMRRHAFSTRGMTVDLERPIQKYDRKTRTLGFHVLHDWDGIADRVNEDIIPVDVLHYLADKRGTSPADPTVLAILLDYYYFHLLALLSLRIWDEGDPNANLDQIARLLEWLQGAHGSGQRFVADAETLILIATSHYELHERGYAALLEKTRTLDAAHRVRIALGHGASMGSHLRFGFEVTYGRDTLNMRNDNVADYPWLCFALATVMKEYARLHAAGERGPARDRLVESMLNGLSADARAIVGAPPSSLAESEDERAEFAASFQALKADLLAEFEPFRPKESAYSPLCFFFNFSHNVLKGTIVDALPVGRPWPISFNALLTGLPDDAGAAKSALAETLMGYARANPHRIRGRLRPVIVYDLAAGRDAFAVTMKKLKD